MTILGQALIDRGIAHWMPAFQAAPTPGFAAAVLGMPPEQAERIDRLEFEGDVKQAQRESDLWLRKIHRK